VWSRHLGSTDDHRLSDRIGHHATDIAFPDDSRNAYAIMRNPVLAAPNLKLLPSILRRDNKMARFQGMSDADKLNDIQILNRALFFENRGVWAYTFAADKLSTSQVGKTVLELGLQNRADHEKHQDMLRNAISELGGTPVQMEKNYDLSSYINKGQGNVDSDVNIAKLALALE